MYVFKVSTAALQTLSLHTNKSACRKSCFQLSTKVDSPRSRRNLCIQPATYCSSSTKSEAKVFSSKPAGKSKGKKNKKKKSKSKKNSEDIHDDRPALAKVKFEPGDSLAAYLTKEAGLQDSEPQQEASDFEASELEDIVDDGDLVWHNLVSSDPGEAEIVVGSCPRTTADILRLKKEAGIEAIVSLQTYKCETSLDIPIFALKENILHTRVSVRDFDRMCMPAMLPEMVRRLATNIAVGRKTYVHCSQGMNPSILVVLGYMNLVKGMDITDALARLNSAHPQAQPYVDCLTICRERMLSGRQHDIYLQTQLTGSSKTKGGDWVKRDWESASRKVIQKDFVRSITSDVQNMACEAFKIEFSKVRDGKIDKQWIFASKIEEDDELLRSQPDRYIMRFI